MQYTGFELLLKAADVSVRIHAYDLLTASSSTNLIVPAELLQCVIRSFPYLHNDNDAYERGEILSITRRLLKRVESGMVNMSKVESPNHIERTKILDEHSSFVDRFIAFIAAELEPGISYPRHILALQTLHLLLRVKVNTGLDYDLVDDPLLNLILDPFNDVRALSAETLKNVMATADITKHKTLLSSTLPAAYELAARSCRQDHADAAGRLGAIAISREVGKLSWSHESIFGLQTFSADAVSEAVNTYLSMVEELRPGDAFPLHAMLLTMMHHLNDNTTDSDNDEDAQRFRIVTTCQNLWSLVKSELCIDSPERATEEDAEDASGGPKDLLAYSWRALRDSR